MISFAHLKLIIYLLIFIFGCSPDDFIHILFYFTSVEIANAIELGDAVDEKEFILDSAKSVIQIGLLDFTLFPEKPEFYATYKLINEKNYSVYSDKLRLSVLDLTRTDLATEEDRQYGIDTWAAFFKANTWEELKMLAHNNDNILEAAATVYQLTQEEKIRQQCEAREDYYRRQNDVKRWIKKQDDTIQQQAEQIQQQEQLIRQMEQRIQQQEQRIQQLIQQKQ